MSNFATFTSSFILFIGIFGSWKLCQTENFQHLFCFCGAENIGTLFPSGNCFNGKTRGQVSTFDISFYFKEIGSSLYFYYLSKKTKNREFGVKPSFFNYHKKYWVTSHIFCLSEQADMLTSMQANRLPLLPN